MYYICIPIIIIQHSEVCMYSMTYIRLGLLTINYPSLPPKRLIVSAMCECLMPPTLVAQSPNIIVSYYVQHYFKLWVWHSCCPPSCLNACLYCTTWAVQRVCQSCFFFLAPVPFVSKREGYKGNILLIDRYAYNIQVTTMYAVTHLVITILRCT